MLAPPLCIYLFIHCFIYSFTFVLMSIMSICFSRVNIMWLSHQQLKLWHNYSNHTHEPELKREEPSLFVSLSVSKVQQDKWVALFFLLHVSHWSMLYPPWFSTGAVLPPEDICQCWDISDCHTWEGEVNVGIWLAEVSEVPKHPTIYRTVSHNNELSSPKHQQCKVEKPCFTVFRIIGWKMDVFTHSLLVLSTPKNKKLDQKREWY